MRESRSRCRNCGNIFWSKDALEARSPFDARDTLTACPQCKQCTEGFDLVCDVAECTETVVCGWPGLGEYRMTCGDHREK
jgi:hypothetical protein